MAPRTKDEGSEGATHARRGYDAALGLLTATLIVFTACASEPLVEDSYDFDERPEAVAELEDWIATGELEVAEAPTAEALFAAGEAAWWNGDFDEAYDHYVAMVVEHPGHPLNRYGVDRLRRMKSELPGFSSRVADDLAGVDYEGEHPLTRLELARLAHDVAYDRWLRSTESEPFEFEHGGAISTWRATPMLSPWPTLDFGDSMRPEQTERLSEFYRSPIEAGPDVANWEPTRFVRTDRPGDSPGLGGRGLYYMEANLEVEGDEPVELTVSGDFEGAARLWIGDQRVLDRADEDYRPGHQLRDVVVQPGDHRVLLKLDWEPGRADDFELLFVPRTGGIWADANVGSHPHVQATGGGGVELASEIRRAERLEPVRLQEVDVAGASDAALYAAALSGYLSGDYRSFGPVYEELMERHPEFVAGVLLGYHQVQTRADLPGDTRRARSLSKLRRAEELAPDNLYVLVELERRLRDHGSDEEHRQVVERSRQVAHDRMTDGAGLDDVDLDQLDAPRLRPFVAWARYLNRQGWTNEAEEAWREVVALDPEHCGAIGRLQSRYRSRHYLPEPTEIAEGADQCPSVLKRWLDTSPELLDRRVELAERRARRHPWSAGRQVDWADALIAADRRDEAAQILEATIERMPERTVGWEARIDMALGEGDEATARRLVDEATEQLGRNARLEWQRARLNDTIPMESLSRYGRAAALEEVRRTGESDDIDEGDESGRAMVLDDAYYVVDFAARKYFEDGSAWTLTHQVVRVMSRGAIDDYAEMSVPRGAELLEIRTIKEDGEVREPDGATGDSTFSMPGLARGDMVEIAYLEFDPASRVASRIDGTPFYFRMPDVSSRLSEYVVLGDFDLQFETANGAPEPEEIEVDGVPGVRFAAEDVRRPRSESRRVSASEYLPWVREYRAGVDEHMLDFERRYMQNAIASSTRMAPKVEDKLEEWLGGPLEDVEVDDDAIRQLFYGATEWFRDPNPGRFTVDAAHALDRRRGSPLIVMRLALTELDVDHDIYLARTDEQHPRAREVGEIDRYPRAILRVRMPESDRIEWLKPDRRTSMFGTFEPELDGQSAVCLTCENFRVETVELDEDRRPSRHVELDASLEKDGTLTGTIRYELDGVRAARVRSALRGQTDEDDRRDYFERVLTDQVSGADVLEYSVENEEADDEPLAFSMDFERRGFARESDGGLVVDRPLFREDMERIYGRESTRKTPLFVGYERAQSYSARIQLPHHEVVEFDDDEVVADNDFADFSRHGRIEDGAYRLDSAIDLPRRRIGADDYPEFRDWARTVEDSGTVWLRLE